MTAAATSSVVYIKRTASDTGRTVITSHSCWDRDLFLQRQQDAERALRDRKDTYNRISIATEAEYRAFAWPRGAQ